MKSPLFVAALGLSCLAAALWAGPRDAQWKKVDDAERARLPKTAIEALEPIITAALADRSHAEAIKAIMRKIALEGSIQGNRPEEKIVRLQEEIAQAPAEIKAVMEVVLAQWYWQYFQQNRWRFLQRTGTTAAPDADLRTWDLARILAEIDRHFTAALADEARLKAMPVTDFDELLERGSVPDTYRPTLFDFLVHEALQFYQTGEQGVTHAEEEFELDATASPIFAGTTEFLAWQPRSPDENAPLLKAVRLLQKLMAFHRADDDRSAFLDADLARLKFGHNKAVGDEGAAQYKAALERFAEAAAKHESSARALAALATLLNEQGESDKAHPLAQRGLEAFPDDAGGVLCFNLLQQIERKEASIATERVWNAPWPTLDLTYRNITKAYFRAVKVEFADYLARTRWNYGQIDQDERRVLLTATPALVWSADLPATPDYRSRTERVPVPDSLPPGFYFVFADRDASFSGMDLAVSVADVWVSTLALVTQTHYDGSELGGFVLDARTGEPIPGATVRAWLLDREGRFSLGEAVSTDVDGRFQIEPEEGRTVVLLAEHRGQAVASMHPMYSGGARREDEPGSHTIFFTDRALYRPGQTIHFKGIAIRYDRDKANYATIARRNVTIVFDDPNGKEITRTILETNDYGSFSGVFTAPRDRLMGQMQLRALEPEGWAAFNVEEYKRPKFHVEIAAPVEAPKLDAPVSLTGKALAYTGAPIGGAKVAWRVERSTRLPRWCWWWQPPVTKAVAHGSVVTDADGTFRIQFTAVPDRSEPPANEPVFVYTVHADVTDITGETRSEQRTLPVGYTALEASVAAAEWQTPRRPVEFTLETRALDGETQAAKGTLTLHALQQPAAVQRAPLADASYSWRRQNDAAKTDASNPETWETGSVVAQRTFAHGNSGTTKLAVPLKAGIYRALLETEDRFGKKVAARQTVRVVDPAERRLPIKQPSLLTAPNWSIEPGGTFTALWGTGYDAGRAFVEVECNGEKLQSYWTSPGRTQQQIEQEITEEMRGGLTVRVTQIRENRAYVNERIVDVPWSNKQLALKWESFRSKLLPGQKETWTAVLTGPGATRAAGEIVAGLYDASLDQLFRPHEWPRGFPVFRREYGRVTYGLHNAPLAFRALPDSGPHPLERAVNWYYRHFFFDVSNRGRWTYVVGSTPEGVIQLSAFQVSTAREGGTLAMSMAARGGGAIAGAVADRSETAASPLLPDVGKVTARKNLSETAFFFPHLLATRKGEVKMAFTMPEALTEWKFFGFAHDKQLRAGFLEDKVVTAKDLMVEPNPPRFVREGDVIEFTVKVTNQTDQPQAGKVRLTFADAASLQPVDAALGNHELDQAFSVPPKQSRSYAWRIVVPDGMGFITYKAVGTTAKLSDGEEGFLPVLSRRILVTESLPLPIRGRGVREFEFAKLLASGQSPTLRHQAVTVQMTSQPAWHAVLALPYLMEYPHECSEQVFNRLYANALAAHIAGSDPKIRRVFDLWRNTPALDSPLEKNADLKSVLLEETPWLRHAQRESEARRNVGVLFDGNRLETEIAAALQVLADRQLGDGLWPWFPGGPPSDYISLYITTGFGRLRHLGAAVDVAAALKSLPGLDAAMDARYRRINDHDRASYVPGSLDALYLYGRSFFLQDRPLIGVQKEMEEFLLTQARKFWTQVGSRQSQAHLALALQRFGDSSTARAVVKSLKERSVTDPELGMFWRDSELSWWWYHAPIETQALMIEAFAEVTADTQAVEDCKVWLLKQKQAQDWKTTKATADAVYALLLRGVNLLASDARVEIALAGQRIEPERTEAGTGFYERRFSAAEIKPAMGRITVTKPDDGVSWGSLHWQYLEDIARIESHTATPLTIRKTLWVKETSAKGRALRPISDAVAVGDELIVRLELRTDRDMEYLHLKDQRGSGTEPVNVISRYKWQDGLAYYESTRDTATHFFIDYLPKGTYVFEYSTRVQLKGRYQTGVAEIQCMYAPEFNSHSESIPIEVR